MMLDGRRTVIFKCAGKLRDRIFCSKKDKDVNGEKHSRIGHVNIIQ